MGPATANFNRAFLQAFTGIAPDHTAMQLNRFSDMAFSLNTLIDKFQTKKFAVFIPESLFWEKHDQDLFWNNPRRLLNVYSFDLVDVCVAGQLLAPAATASAVVFLYVLTKYSKPFGVSTAIGATSLTQVFATAANKVQGLDVTKRSRHTQLLFRRRERKPD